MSKPQLPGQQGLMLNHETTKDEVRRQDACDQREPWLFVDPETRGEAAQTTAAMSMPASTFIQNRFVTSWWLISLRCTVAVESPKSLN